LLIPGEGGEGERRVELACGRAHLSRETAGAGRWRLAPCRPPAGPCGRPAAHLERGPPKTLCLMVRLPPPPHLHRRGAFRTLRAEPCERVDLTCRQPDGVARHPILAQAADVDQLKVRQEHVRAAAEGEQVLRQGHRCAAAASCGGGQLRRCSPRPNGRLKRSPSHQSSPGIQEYSVEQGKLQERVLLASCVPAFRASRARGSRQLRYLQNICSVNRRDIEHADFLALYCFSHEHRALKHVDRVVDIDQSVCARAAVQQAVGAGGVGGCAWMGAHDHCKAH
jgi:hypothetical protein